MTDQKPNAELAYKVLDHIDAHPEQWDQKHWCGTAMCFAGWTVALSGIKVDEEGFIPLPGGGEEHLSNRASRLLGFADTEVVEYSLFSAIATRKELGAAVAEIFGPRPESPAASAP